MAFEKFHFTTSDDKEIVVPYAMDALKRKQVRKINEDHGDNQAALEDAMLKAALDTKTYNLIDDLTLRDYMRFMESWAQEGTPNVGES